MIESELRRAVYMNEFKKFIAQGNVIDLAVAVIIGAAFGKIVTSLVNDILMPVIGLFTGGLDFTNFFISLNGTSYATLAEAQEAGAATINYGMFINNIIDFLIIAFCIFLIIKQLQRFKKEEPAAPVTTKTCSYCCSTIAIEASRCPHCTSQLD